MDRYIMISRIAAAAYLPHTLRMISKLYRELLSCKVESPSKESIYTMKCWLYGVERKWKYTKSKMVINLSINQSNKKTIPLIPAILFLILISLLPNNSPQLPPSEFVSYIGSGLRVAYRIDSVGSPRFH